MYVLSDEWWEDEEYIDSENDPHAVEEITKEDYTFPTDEEIAEFDKIFETVRAKSANLTNHDSMMEKKVLDLMKRGKLK